MVAWEVQCPSQELGLRFSSPLFPEAQGQGSGEIWTGALSLREAKTSPQEGGRKWLRPYGRDSGVVSLSEGFLLGSIPHLVPL